MSCVYEITLYGEIVGDRYDIDLPVRICSYATTGLWGLCSNVQEALNIRNGFVDETRMALKR